MKAISLFKFQKPMYNDAIKALKSDNLRSSYYAGTGAGKTKIYQKVIQKMFKSKQRQVVLVVHPTLNLSSDQQARFKEDGFDVPFSSFHSGVVSQSSTKVKNKATINPEELIQILEDTNDEHHIVFTSYHSLSKIAHLDIFDLIICDEAHNILAKNARVSLETMVGRVMFFTATPVIPDSDEGVSMDDVKLFGKNVAENNIIPSELVKMERMVMPKIIRTRIKTSAPNEETSEDLVTTIGLVFKDQRDNHVHSELNPKMLVALPNTLRFSDIEKHMFELRKHAGDMNIDIYTVTGEGQNKNGTGAEATVFKTRASILEDFKDNTNPCIIIHCDTLAEGIDIDGLTGAFVARSLSHTKFIQTIGRPTRPLIDDIIDGRTGDKRLKPSAPIHVAVVDGDDQNPKMNEYMEALMASGYGAIIRDVIKDMESCEGSKKKPEDEPLSAMRKVLDIEFEEMLVVERLTAGAW